MGSFSRQHMGRKGLLTGGCKNDGLCLLGTHQGKPIFPLDRINLHITGIHGIVLEVISLDTGSWGLLRFPGILKGPVKLQGDLTSPPIVSVLSAEQGRSLPQKLRARYGTHIMERKHSMEKQAKDEAWL